VRKRQTLFREAVIVLICGNDQQTVEDQYCRTCRAAAKRSGKAPDCTNCTKDIKAVKD